MIARGPGDRVQDLVQTMQDDGVEMPAEDAQAILDAPCMRNPTTQEQLRQIRSNVQQLMPLVDGLRHALEVERTLETAAGSGGISVGPRIEDSRNAAARYSMCCAANAPIHGTSASYGNGDVQGGVRTSGPIGSENA